ncbi:hypothetical protein EP331_02660 [bacterium]|nr:MAG: hypothetical protein EP331_02660 [bacterium]
MYFVFDIETIPDFEFIERAVSRETQNRDELLELASEELARNKSGFLPPMYHQMVSWVGFWIDDLGNPKSEHRWNGKDEKQGLLELIDSLSMYKDFRLIHHNGKGFDIPLVVYRAMKHHLQLPARFNTQDIRYRYSKDNVDLVDEFSNYGASSFPKLKHLGLLIGVPFKQTGEGNLVLEMFDKGELAKIEHYCLEDVIATYLIWLHYKYTVGEFKPEHYENLRERATRKLIQVQESTPE